MQDDEHDEQRPQFLGYPLWQWIIALIGGIAFFCALMWQGKIALFWLIASAVTLVLLSAIRCALVLLSAILRS